jgi:hypothetical protein
MLPLLVFCSVLLLPTAPRSSTVLALDIGALAERSERIVRATVVDSESWRDGIVWTRISLRVDENWRGSGAAQIELVQPGGRVPGFGTKVFGMPEFALDEDVVVFLREGRVYGLAQGKFSVDERGNLSRDTRDLALARVGGHRAPSALPAPSGVQALRTLVVLDDL